MKKILSSFLEVFKIVIIALLIVVPIRYFIFQPFVVRGISMEPNFHSGDYLIVDEISYRFREPQRGDVIVFKYPKKPSQRFIKRIIGLPNETVEIDNGKVIVYNPEKAGQVLNELEYLSLNQNTAGKSITKLGPNEYFVLGDNRAFSSDSRRWGVLPVENIIGKVFSRVFSFAAFAGKDVPTY